MEHENELVRQIVNGDKELFEQIVLEYQNLVFTVCLNIVNDSGDAENMAQEAFLTAFCSLSAFRGGSFKSWLCRIAVNKSVDFKRKQAKTVTEDIEEHTSLGGNAVEEIFDRQEQREKVAEALNGIPEKYSSVIKEFYYNRLPVKEIAARQKMPEKTVETRLYRAKKLFKERWGNNDA